MEATFAPGIVVPLRPFFGSMGVAPAPELGRVSSNPPGRHAGNLDNRELVAGSTFDPWDFVAYVHDEWRVGSALTLNLGLRYAPTTNPTVNPGTQFLNPPNSSGFVPVSTTGSLRVLRMDRGDASSVGP